jgi:hypothetical protein
MSNNSLIPPENTNINTLTPDILKEFLNNFSNLFGEQKFKQMTGHKNTKKIKKAKQKLDKTFKKIM